MGDPRGFLTTGRQDATRRPVDVRIQDWREVYERVDEPTVRGQAGRCMDCGVAFCHAGCPLGNLIPEWNDLVYTDDWAEASERLHATNNFPEFTGRLCPAPCEPACVLAINDKPVTIKQVEKEIADRAWDDGNADPRPPSVSTGRSVAVVGSGPGGLAAAQQLTRAGHRVVVYERDDRIGGLMRYGIPDFKMDKVLLDRRLAQMEAEGTELRAGVDVGHDVTGEDLRAEYDAVVLAVGALRQRDVDAPGRDLDGVHLAMEYLTYGNRVQAGDLDVPPVDASGRHVVILGGGDTGADCLGTAHRQGAASVTQLQIHPQPPETPTADNPWPTVPMVFSTSPAHEEGGDRVYAAGTEMFVGGDQGRIRALRFSRGRRVEGRWEAEPGTEQETPCDLALLAIGFAGVQESPLYAQLDLEVGSRGVLVRDDRYATATPGVFVAGDAGRGQSLVVWAIAEGRAAAAAVDRYLAGGTTLPAPLEASAQPLR
ncbi:MAG: glutamate synthase subunit beta [Actinomycetes bacterium]